MGVTPMVLFDGARVPIKHHGTGVRRREQMQDARETLAKDLNRLGPGEFERACAAVASLTDADYRRTFEVLTTACPGIIVERALFEADSELVDLYRTKTIDSIVSADSDFLLHGVALIVPTKGAPTEWRYFRADAFQVASGLQSPLGRYLVGVIRGSDASLSGLDLRGVGLKTAVNLVQVHLDDGIGAVVEAALKVCNDYASSHGAGRTRIPTQAEATCAVNMALVYFRQPVVWDRTPAVPVAKSAAGILNGMVKLICGDPAAIANHSSYRAVDTNQAGDLITVVTDATVLSADRQYADRLSTAWGALARADRLRRARAAKALFQMTPELITTQEPIQGNAGTAEQSGQSAIPAGSAKRRASSTPTPDAGSQPSDQLVFATPETESDHGTASQKKWRQQTMTQMLEHNQYAGAARIQPTSLFEDTGSPDLNSVSPLFATEAPAVTTAPSSPALTATEHQFAAGVDKPCANTGCALLAAANETVCCGSCGTGVFHSAACSRFK